jgi:hypothetical protein
MITPVWAVGLLLEDLERPPLTCSVPLMTHGERSSGWLVMTGWYGSRVAHAPTRVARESSFVRSGKSRRLFQR